MGWGVVESLGMNLYLRNFGCIETPSNEEMPKRLEIIYTDLGELISSYSPDFLCVEKLFFGRNRTTAEMVWQARGIVLLSGAQRGLKIIEPIPSQIKMAVCGNGKADKTQVQRMVQRILSIEELPRPDDAADALAIAITGLSLYSIKERLERI
ncbi:MAG: crossover junction endodeoxyribonuclease RuvC [Synergistaceae bacterium]|nr:crossover junction endodeoxyribonuclease RuvC [Synergistaceae bacterium]